MSNIESRHKEVLERIARAAERAGRDPAEITLIAVSKTFDTDVVKEAFDCGIRDFGENKVQELVAKHKELPDLQVRWHFVGHLQTNKVKHVLPAATMIHSIDSTRLATKINDLAPGPEPVDVLIQINTSDEETKFGIGPDELQDLITAIAPLSSLRVRGLMTLGPLTDDLDAIRRSFLLLRECSLTLRETRPEATILSMGMTGDYEIAIEEGATHVRVGTAIFGPRTYAR